MSAMEEAKDEEIRDLLKKNETLRAVEAIKTIEVRDEVTKDLTGEMQKIRAQALQDRAELQRAKEREAKQTACLASYKKAMFLSILWQIYMSTLRTYFQKFRHFTLGRFSVINEGFAQKSVSSQKNGRQLDAQSKQTADQQWAASPLNSEEAGDRFKIGNSGRLVDVETGVLLPLALAADGRTVIYETDSKTKKTLLLGPRNEAVKLIDGALTLDKQMGRQIILPGLRNLKKRVFFAKNKMDQDLSIDEVFALTFTGKLLPEVVEVKSELDNLRGSKLTPRDTSLGLRKRIYSNHDGTLFLADGRELLSTNSIPVLTHTQHCVVRCPPTAQRRSARYTTECGAPIAMQNGQPFIWTATDTACTTGSDGETVLTPEGEILVSLKTGNPVRVSFRRGDDTIDTGSTYAAVDSDGMSVDLREFDGRFAATLSATARFQPEVEDIMHDEDQPLPIPIIPELTQIAEEASSSTIPKVFEKRVVEIEKFASESPQFSPECMMVVLSELDSAGNPAYSVQSNAVFKNSSNEWIFTQPFTVSRYAEIQIELYEVLGDEEVYLARTTVQTVGNTVRFDGIDGVLSLRTTAVHEADNVYHHLRNLGICVEEIPPHLLYIEHPDSNTATLKKCVLNSSIDSKLVKVCFDHRVGAIVPHLGLVTPESASLADDAANREGGGGGGGGGGGLKENFDEVLKEVSSLVSDDADIADVQRACKLLAALGVNAEIPNEIPSVLPFDLQWHPEKRCFVVAQRARPRTLEAGVELLEDLFVYGITLERTELALSINTAKGESVPLARLGWDQENLCFVRERQEPEDTEAGATPLASACFNVLERYSLGLSQGAVTVDGFASGISWNNEKGVFTISSTASGDTAVHSMIEAAAERGLTVDKATGKIALTASDETLPVEFTRGKFRPSKTSLDSSSFHKELSERGMSIHNGAVQVGAEITSIRWDEAEGRFVVSPNFVPPTDASPRGASPDFFSTEGETQKVLSMLEQHGATVDEVTSILSVSGHPIPVSWNADTMQFVYSPELREANAEGCGTPEGRFSCFTKCCVAPFEPGSQLSLEEKGGVGIMQLSGSPLPITEQLAWDYSTGRIVAVPRSVEIYSDILAELGLSVDPSTGILDAEATKEAESTVLPSFASTVLIWDDSEQRVRRAQLPREEISRNINSCLYSVGLKIEQDSMRLVTYSVNPAEGVEAGNRDSLGFRLSDDSLGGSLEEERAVAFTRLFSAAVPKGEIVWREAVLRFEQDEMAKRRKGALLADVLAEVLSLAGIDIDPATRKVAALPISLRDAMRNDLFWDPASLSVIPKITSERVFAKRAKEVVDDVLYDNLCAVEEQRALGFTKIARWSEADGFRIDVLDPHAQTLILKEFVMQRIDSTPISPRSSSDAIPLASLLEWESPVRGGGGGGPLLTPMLNTSRLNGLIGSGVCLHGDKSDYKLSWDEAVGGFMKVSYMDNQDFAERMKRKEERQNLKEHSTIVRVLARCGLRLGADSRSVLVVPPATAALPITILDDVFDKIAYGSSQSTPLKAHGGTQVYCDLSANCFYTCEPSLASLACQPLPASSSFRTTVNIIPNEEQYNANLRTPQYKILTYLSTIVDRRGDELEMFKNESGAKSVASGEEVVIEEPTGLPVESAFGLVVRREGKMVVLLPEVDVVDSSDEESGSEVENPWLHPWETVRGRFGVSSVAVLPAELGSSFDARTKLAQQTSPPPPTPLIWRSTNLAAVVSPSDGRSVLAPDASLIPHPISGEPLQFLNGRLCFPESDRRRFATNDYPWYHLVEVGLLPGETAMGGEGAKRVLVLREFNILTDTVAADVNKVMCEGAERFSLAAPTYYDHGGKKNPTKTLQITPDGRVCTEEGEMVLFVEEGWVQPCGAVVSLSKGTEEVTAGSPRASRRGGVLPPQSLSVPTHTRRRAQPCYTTNLSVVLHASFAQHPLVTGHTPDAPLSLFYVNAGDASHRMGSGIFTSRISNALCQFVPSSPMLGTPIMIPGSEANGFRVNTVAACDENGAVIGVHADRPAEVKGETVIMAAATAAPNGGDSTPAYYNVPYLQGLGSVVFPTLLAGGGTTPSLGLLLQTNRAGCYALHSVVGHKQMKHLYTLSGERICTVPGSNVPLSSGCAALRGEVVVERWHTHNNRISKRYELGSGEVVLPHPEETESSGPFLWGNGTVCHTAVDGTTLLSSDGRVLPSRADGSPVTYDASRNMVIESGVHKRVTELTEPAGEVDLRACLHFLCGEDFLSEHEVALIRGRVERGLADDEAYNRRTPGVRGGDGGVLSEGESLRLLEARIRQEAEEIDAALTTSKGEVGLLLEQANQNATQRVGEVFLVEAAELNERTEIAFAEVCILFSFVAVECRFHAYVYC